MSDTRTDNLNLYAIGASSDNIGEHMITHYNYNMTLLDSYIAAHDIESIAMSDGVLTITSLDGTTYSADLGVAGVVAEAFSTSTSYAVGDYCIQDGALYKCTTAHTGDWSDSDFTATTVMAELDELETTVSTNTANIATNAENIATNTTNIATNAENIATNTENIATNTTNIATNTTNIATNTTNIATNTANIEQLNSDLTDKTSYARTDITSLVSDGTLSTAIAEQNLGKYGIKIGDYFTGTNYTYVVADMDPFYGGYDSYVVVSTHHIGLLAITNTSAQWNTSADTSTGYAGSNLHTYMTETVLPKVQTDIATLTGDAYTSHLLAHYKRYTTATSGGWAWSSSQYISALTELQIYGAPIFSIDGLQQGEGDKKLEVFSKYKYNEVFGGGSWWLRSIYSSSRVCYANSGGFAHTYETSESLSVAGLILFY